jgi:hypothetical protein
VGAYADPGVSETGVLTRAHEHALLQVTPSAASTASSALGAIHHCDCCADWNQTESRATIL